MMSEKTKDIVYRLCMLAESFWIRHSNESDFKDKETAVFKGDQDDPEWCCDEWTMFKEDYDNILLIKECLEMPKFEIKSLLTELEPCWPKSDNDQVTIQGVCSIKGSGKSLKEEISEIPDDVYVFDGLTPEGYIQDIRDRMKNKS